MSDYLREKCVRLVLAKKSNENFMSDIFKTEAELDVFENKIYPASHFTTNYCLDYGTNDSYINLDYVLISEYGEETGDWGRSRALSESEYAKYAKLFKQHFPELPDNMNLRLVEYCYYNCCECQQYFDESTDDFYMGV